MEATTDWKMGAGYTLQPHSLGIADKCPPPPPRTQPKFPSFVWDLEGAQTCFIFRDQTTGYLKSHHLQARVTLTALSVPPRQPFLSAEFWVIRYHLGYLGSEQSINMCLNFQIMHYRIYSQCAKKTIIIFSGTHGLFGSGATLSPVLNTTFTLYSMQ